MVEDEMVRSFTDSMDMNLRKPQEVGKTEESSMLQLRVTESWTQLSNSKATVIKCGVLLLGGVVFVVCSLLVYSTSAIGVLPASFMTLSEYPHALHWLQKDTTATQVSCLEQFI